MTESACNQSRRTLLKGIAATTLLCPLYSSSVFANPKKRLYIDGLSFLPENLADVAASKLDAYVCDISAIEPIKQADGTTNYKRTYKACIESIKKAEKIVAENPKILLQGLTGSDISKAQNEQRTAVYFQIQGADCVDADADKGSSEDNHWPQLTELHQHGLRVLQLTHHYGNRFAGGALDNDGFQGLDKPLTEDGKMLIAELNKRNILIDVSHSSPQTALDTAKITNKPIVQSHGAVRSIVNNARCSPDEVIRAIADTGGVFGIFMMSFWLTNDPVPTIDDYIRQLDRVARIGGMNAVAIANDYPLRGQENLLALDNDNAEGVKQYLGWWQSLADKNVLGFDHTPEHVVIPELNHIDRMSRIDDALAKARYKSSDRDRFLGGNWQRVLNQVLV
ncbi:membrane dipeptidase [Shewanella donghaensis]|uniref:membrane dipeptidase n=1 Tax=Shewanella donghaensis TaxID=238836 RepID=UPI00118256A2|nr:membrane dipeptidase [Shewanella donghaensis]